MRMSPAVNGWSEGDRVVSGTALAGAIVRALGPDGAVLAEAVADEAGAFSLALPEGIDVTSVSLVAVGADGATSPGTDMGSAIARLNAQERARVQSEVASTVSALTSNIGQGVAGTNLYSGYAQPESESLPVLPYALGAGVGVLAVGVAAGAFFGIRRATGGHDEAVMLGDMDARAKGAKAGTVGSILAGAAGAAGAAGVAGAEAAGTHGSAGATKRKGAGRAAGDVVSTGEASPAPGIMPGIAGAPVSAMAPGTTGAVAPIVAPAPVGYPGAADEEGDNLPTEVFLAMGAQGASGSAGEAAADEGAAGADMGAGLSGVDVAAEHEGRVLAALDADVTDPNGAFGVGDATMARGHVADGAGAEAPIAMPGDTASFIALQAAQIGEDLPVALAGVSSGAPAGSAASAAGFSADSATVASGAAAGADADAQADGDGRTDDDVPLGSHAAGAWPTFSTAPTAPAARREPASFETSEFLAVAPNGSQAPVGTVAGTMATGSFAPTGASTMPSQTGVAMPAAAHADADDLDPLERLALSFTAGGASKADDDDDPDPDDRGPHGGARPSAAGPSSPSNAPGGLPIDSSSMPPASFLSRHGEHAAPAADLSGLDAFEQADVSGAGEDRADPLVATGDWRALALAELASDAAPSVTGAHSLGSTSGDTDAYAALVRSTLPRTPVASAPAPAPAAYVAPVVGPSTPPRVAPLLRDAGMRAKIERALAMHGRLGGTGLDAFSDEAKPAAGATATGLHAAKDAPTAPAPAAASSGYVPAASSYVAPAAGGMHAAPAASVAPVRRVSSLSVPLVDAQADMAPAVIPMAVASSHSRYSVQSKAPSRGRSKAEDGVPCIQRATPGMTQTFSAVAAPAPMAPAGSGYVVPEIGDLVDPLYEPTTRLNLAGAFAGGAASQPAPASVAPVSAHSRYGYAQGGAAPMRPAYIPASPLHHAHQARAAVLAASAPVYVPADGSPYGAQPAVSLAGTGNLTGSYDATGLARDAFATAAGDTGMAQGSAFGAQASYGMAPTATTYGTAAQAPVVSAYGPAAAAGGMQGAGLVGAMGTSQIGGALGTVSTFPAPSAPRQRDAAGRSTYVPAIGDTGAWDASDVQPVGPAMSSDPSDAWGAVAASPAEVWPVAAPSSSSWETDGFSAVPAAFAASAAPDAASYGFAPAPTCSPAATTAPNVPAATTAPQAVAYGATNGMAGLSAAAPSHAPVYHVASQTVARRIGALCQQQDLAATVAGPSWQADSTGATQPTGAVPAHITAPQRIAASVPTIYGGSDELPRPTLSQHDARLYEASPLSPAYIDYLVKDEFEHRHDSPAQRAAATGQFHVINGTAVKPKPVHRAARHMA